jgi:glycine cleavage system H protein
MKINETLLYTKNHEWVRVEGDIAFIGITDYAQHAMGDIVYVEAPEVDDEIKAEEGLGVVESVKAASDIYAPISGTVLEINEDLEDSPEMINKKPYDAFIVKVSIDNKDELDELLNAKEYTDYTNTLND